MATVGDLFKATDKIPAVGKYRCIICGLVVDINEHIVAHGGTFFTCPVCKAGGEDGPLTEADDVWEYLGA